MSKKNEHVSRDPTAEKTLSAPPNLQDRKSIEVWLEKEAQVEGNEELSADLVLEDIARRVARAKDKADRLSDQVTRVWEPETRINATLLNLYQNDDERVKAQDTGKYFTERLEAFQKLEEGLKTGDEDSINRMRTEYEYLLSGNEDYLEEELSEVDSKLNEKIKSEEALEFKSLIEARLQAYTQKKTLSEEPYSEQFGLAETAYDFLLENIDTRLNQNEIWKKVNSCKGTYRTLQPLKRRISSLELLRKK